MVVEGIRGERERGYSEFREHSRLVRELFKTIQDDDDTVQDVFQQMK